MKFEVFTQNVIVTSSDIDERHHVNNLIYLQWCLDAAETHWHTKTTKALIEQYVWYVLDHSISYKASAFEGEELEVKTWVTGYSGVRSTREYQILRINDQKVLVEAKTTWCLLDGKTQRPAKITEEIATLFVKTRSNGQY